MENVRLLVHQCDYYINQTPSEPFEHADAEIKLSSSVDIKAVVIAVYRTVQHNHYSDFPPEDSKPLCFILPQAYSKQDFLSSSSSIPYNETPLRQRTAFLLPKEHDSRSQPNSVNDFPWRARLCAGWEKIEGGKKQMASHDACVEKCSPKL